MADSPRLSTLDTAPPKFAFLPGLIATVVTIPAGAFLIRVMYELANWGWQLWPS